MRLFLSALLLVTSPAMAAEHDHGAEWKEYPFPEFGVVKEFPADPHRERLDYRSEAMGGQALPSVSQSVDFGDTFFRMTVIDLTAPGYQAKLGEIVGECISKAEAQGRPLRMQVIRADDGTPAGVRGRVASVDLAWNLGFRQTGCYYHGTRLYRVEGTMVHPNDEDAEMLARFVTGLRFNVAR